MTPWARGVAPGAEVREEASEPCLQLCVVTQIKELASNPGTYRTAQETVRSKLPAFGIQISRGPAQPSVEAVSAPTVPKLLGTNFQGFFLELHLSPFAYTL